MKKFTRIIFCLLIFIFIFSIFSSQNFVNALNDEENDDIYEQNASSFDEPFAGINFDEWRIISLDDNNNPFLQKPVDYSTNPDLLKYVKKGDIIYESTFGSDILDYTNFIGHIALVVDIYYDEYYNQEYILVVEAVETGVIYSVLTPYKFTAVESRILRLKNATSEQIDSAISFVKDQVGKDYRLFEGYSTNYNETDWYCSELVYAGYYNAGIQLPAGNLFIYPNDILNSNLVTLIMHEDYPTSSINNNNGTHTITCNGISFTETHNYLYNIPCTGICRACNATIGGHDYNYINYNSQYHKKYCICGMYELLEHSFSFVANKYVCNVCRFKTTHIHNFSYNPDGFGLNHIIICSCGYSSTEACMGFNNVCLKCNQTINTGNGPILNAVLQSDNIDLLIKKDEEDEIYE